MTRLSGRPPTRRHYRTRARHPYAHSVAFRAFGRRLRRTPYGRVARTAARVGQVIREHGGFQGHSRRAYRKPTRYFLAKHASGGTWNRAA